MNNQIKISFKDYLSEIYDKPSKIHEAYRLFRNYSPRNRILAESQLLNLEPINTYKGWQDLGRQVKKGGRGISLFLPVASKKKKDDEGKNKKKGEGDNTAKLFCSANFIMKKHWFALSQTEGEEFKPEELPNFDVKKALEDFGITQEKFRSINGNCQGYAIPSKNIIAINPLAFAPYKTIIHEIAHCLLHKESSQIIDGAELDSSIKEFEAETTAYLVCCSLGKFDHLEYSRGYITNWIQRNDIEEENFKRAFDAANKILKAGFLEGSFPKEGE
jgi:antirestriction protein ArdC